MTDTKRPCSHYLLGESVDGVDYCTCGFAYATHDVPARRAVFTLAERRPPVELPWDPVTLLKELVADIESGKIVTKSLMVCYTEETSDGGKRPITWSAGSGYAEGIALAFMEMQRLAAVWRKD